MWVFVNCLIGRVLLEAIISRRFCREPHVRLADQGEHDAAVEELRLQVRTEREVQQGPAEMRHRGPSDVLGQVQAAGAGRQEVQLSEDLKAEGKSTWKIIA